MKVSEHILYGGAASLAITPAFGYKTMLFFIGTILIDLDHYIDFLYYGKFKDWSIKNMFRFHGTMSKWIEKPNILVLEAFHTLEFLAALLIIGFYFHSVEIYLLLFGMVFHMGLDLIRLTKLKKVTVRALSFTEYIIRSKKMLRSGVHPESIFREAYAAISKD